MPKTRRNDDSFPPFTFRLPPDLRARLEAEEKTTGAKPGAIVRIALERYFAAKTEIGPTENKRKATK